MQLRLSRSAGGRSSAESAEGCWEAGEGICLPRSKRRGLGRACERQPRPRFVHPLRAGVLGTTRPGAVAHQRAHCAGSGRRRPSLRAPSGSEGVDGNARTWKKTSRVSRAKMRWMPLARASEANRPNSSSRTMSATPTRAVLRRASALGRVLVHRVRKVDQHGPIEREAGGGEEEAHTSAAHHAWCTHHCLPHRHARGMSDAAGMIDSGGRSKAHQCRRGQGGPGCGHRSATRAGSRPAPP